MSVTLSEKEIMDLQTEVSELRTLARQHIAKTYDFDPVTAGLIPLTNAADMEQMAKELAHARKHTMEELKAMHRAPASDGHGGKPGVTSLHGSGGHANQPSGSDSIGQVTDKFMKNRYAVPGKK